MYYMNLDALQFSTYLSEIQFGVMLQSEIQLGEIQYNKPKLTAMRLLLLFGALYQPKNYFF